MKVSATSIEERIVREIDVGERERVSENGIEKWESECTQPIGPAECLRVSKGWSE